MRAELGDVRRLWKRACGWAAFGCFGTAINIPDGERGWLLLLDIASVLVWAGWAVYFAATWFKLRHSLHVWIAEESIDYVEIDERLVHKATHD